MRRYLLPFALGVLLSACSTAKRGPIGFWSRQRYDQQLLRHGPWPMYYDTARQQPQARGRFRHGQYAGRWRYYGPTGALERTEKFVRQPYGLITVTVYDPSGRKRRLGQARLVDEPDGLHFFWFGDWQVFDTQGRQTAVEHYDQGVLRGTLVIPVDVPVP